MVAQSLNNLAAVMVSYEKYAEAETYLRQALETWQKLLGTEHPEVGTALSNLGWVLARQGDLVESEAVQRQALKVHRAALGEEHPMVATTMINLGAVIAERGDFPVAERLLIDAHERLLRQTGPGNPRTEKAREKLAELYERWGKPQKRALYASSGGGRPG